MGEAAQKTGVGMRKGTHSGDKGKAVTQSRNCAFMPLNWAIRPERLKSREPFDAQDRSQGVDIRGDRDDPTEFTSGIGGA
jgi:hypothetical protein